MRQPALLSLILPLLVSGCSQDTRNAPVQVEVTYAFKAGCISVHARDAEDAGHETLDQLEVLTRGPSTVHFTVSRKKGWSRTLELTVAAHEQSCDGPVVAEEVRTVEFQEVQGEPLALTLTAPDEDADGYMPTASGGTDCNDGDGAISPGAAELCDARDNNCDGNADEGVIPNWYPDRDNDTFGDQAASPIASCTVPSGTTRYVRNNSDCRDSDATMYPRASTFLETRCDGLDDDCDGVVDDGFVLKGTPCSEPCSGVYICNASRTSLVCNGPAPTSYYPDADKDGAGDRDTPYLVCPGSTPPVGALTNGDDCDDQDPHNRGGRTEVCDSRDNTCDGQRDEGNACSGKGWRTRTDSALTGSRSWRTVALGSGGSQVWVAGLGGVLAVRASSGHSFTSRDGGCNTRNWRAAWVRPSDGDVFLAGDDGYLAQHNGSICASEAQVASTNDLTGIVGFESGSTTVLYVVDARGRLYVWTPGSAPVERYNTSPPTYFGIHGLSSSLLLAVGGQESAPFGAHIASYPGTGDISAVKTHTLNNVPSNYAGSLRAVWMRAPGLAYAVGDDGLVLKWNGTTSWTQVPPPLGADLADFTSVGILDENSVYVTDTDGRIHLRTAAHWLGAPLYDADRALWDIAIHSPSELWAVGENGLVLHFAE